MFPDVCAPSLLKPLLGHFRTSAGGGRWTEKGQSILSRLQRPQPHPSRALRLQLPGGRTSRLVCNPDRLSGFTPSSTSPGPAGVPVFKYPSSNCDGGGDSSWEPGLSPPPPWLSPVCPRAPWPERNVEPSACPLPPGLSARYLSRDTLVRGSDSTRTSLGCVGSSGRERVITVDAHSRRSNPERSRPPRQGDATITVKTNPHPLSPPARLSRRPRDAAAALAGGGDHSLDAPPL